jgi:hypothetical protein
MTNEPKPRPSIQGIADIVAGIKLDPETAGKLSDAMSDYATRYPRSLSNLMRTPGFAKLWIALTETVEDDAPYRVGFED